MQRVLAAGVLAIAVTPQAIACEPALPFHLRVEDCRFAAAVADAAAQSSTLSALIERIQNSNALIFVGPPPNFGPGSKLLGGVYYDTEPSAGAYRIVKVFVSRNTGDEAIATFGHELRHVLEMLEAGAKDDLEAKARDGRDAWHSGFHTIETQAAVDAGNAIKRELKAAKRKR